MSLPAQQNDMIIEEDPSKKMEVEEKTQVDSQVVQTPLTNLTVQKEKPSSIQKQEAPVQAVSNGSNSSVAVVPVKPLTKQYNFGSNEMDQFWLPDERSETRRPYLNALLAPISIVQVACGSLHILALSDQGLVYSSGQNDDGALGRPDEASTDSESDKKSKQIQLPTRVNMISAGDSHSVAANSELGVCFLWGTYRNTEKANLVDPVREPVRVGEKEFAKKKFSKILSGQQHTLVLTEDGDVFGWGDPDMGVVGRMRQTRQRYQQALKISKITSIKAADIYSGGRHSFLKRLIRKAVPASEGVDAQDAVYHYYSWGLNNFGQLGLSLSEEEHVDLIFEPTKIDFFDGREVVNICGGESHSLVLLKDGSIYGFGRNDIGQFGIGKIKSTHPKLGEVAESYSKPILIDSIPESAKKISKIWTGSNYCYAQDESGQCFSWGFGTNFVLGNRKDIDEDEFTPYTIPLDFFKGEIPYQFALGSQHVSYWVNLTDVVPQVSKELLLQAPSEYLPTHLRTKVEAENKVVTTAFSRNLASKKAVQEKELADKKDSSEKKEANGDLKEEKHSQIKDTKKESSKNKSEKAVTESKGGSRKSSQTAKKREDSVGRKRSSSKSASKPKGSPKESNGKSKEKKGKSQEPKGKSKEGRSKEVASKSQKSTQKINPKRKISEDKRESSQPRKTKIKSEPLVINKKK